MCIDFSHISREPLGMLEISILRKIFAKTEREITASDIYSNGCFLNKIHPSTKNDSRFNNINNRQDYQRRQ